jgi:hypothetical protein
MLKTKHYKPLALSGVATAGKDTFCRLLIREFASRGIVAKRFALADELKKKTAPFISELCSFDIFNCTAEQKELVRDLMVAVGKIKRAVSQGQYWTSLVSKQIQKAANEADQPFVPVITDVRFDEYENDEVSWVKSQGGLLVHISRFDCDGNLVPPANQSEELNNPKVISAADIRIVAQNVNTDERMNLAELSPQVNRIVDYYLSHE